MGKKEFLEQNIIEQIFDMVLIYIDYIYIIKMHNFIFMQ